LAISKFFMPQAAQQDKRDCLLMFFLKVAMIRDEFVVEFSACISCINFLNQSHKRMVGQPHKDFPIRGCPRFFAIFTFFHPLPSNCFFFSVVPSLGHECNLLESFRSGNGHCVLKSVTASEVNHGIFHAKTYLLFYLWKYKRKRAKNTFVWCAEG
jgi:hypothetical protein